MLSVGREINIRSKRLMCRKCSWQGVGAELRTGLIRISGGDMYLYAYRCPECASFDVSVKAKILAFRAPAASSAHEISRVNAEHDAAQHPRTLERKTRSWK